MIIIFSVRQIRTQQITVVKYCIIIKIGHTVNIITEYTARRRPTAVCGINLLLSDGELCDVGVAEPFGYIAHPRTVAGICADGKVIVAVIDGRRPWHSNGATLTDAALLLKAHGAVRGINLDGGGSSTFIVKTDDGELTMLNHPADLHRPTEDLIRNVFNSIIIVKK